jgi:hypothetical protein
MSVSHIVMIMNLGLWAVLSYECRVILWLNYKVVQHLIASENHGWASLHGFTVRVVTATALGQDIAAQAPPMPTPQVAWAAQVFFACTSWTSVHHFPKRWITLGLPLVVNAFGHLGCLLATISAASSAFSSQRLQNRTIFHNFSNATDHLSLQRLQIPIITIITSEGSGPPHCPRVVAWRAGGLDHVDIDHHIVSQDSDAQIFHLW